MIDQRVAVLGLGKIGTILLRGLLKAGLSPSNACATVRHADRTRHVRRQRFLIAERYIFENIGEALRRPRRLRRAAAKRRGQQAHFRIDEHKIGVCAGLDHTFSWI